MTIWNRLLKMSSTDQWQFRITVGSIGMGYHRKLSLTGQWQFWSLPWVVLGIGYHRKLSLTGQWQFWRRHLKLSLTGQWQFWRQSDWDLVKAENHWLIFLIMDIPLMAKCHLPQSMTKIYGQNFKKNVIDDGQWQKNCHLLKGIYPGIGLAFLFVTCMTVIHTFLLPWNVTK